MAMRLSGLGFQLTVESEAKRHPAITREMPPTFLANAEPK